MRDELSRRRPSPVTIWLAMQALALGVHIDVVRNMTWRQFRAARMARAN